MTNETLKSLVKENLDEFVKWLDDNGWAIETGPKLRFVDANGIALPFTLAAGVWAGARQKAQKALSAAEEVEKALSEI